MEFDGKSLFSFKINFPNRSRFYYTESEAVLNKWLDTFSQIITSDEFIDSYSIVKQIGKGRVGVVNLAEHKESGRLVAIKKLEKPKMSELDFSLVKAEVDILKVCHHPSILAILDYFEGEQFIYTITEYCSYGDLYSWLEERNFAISEWQAAKLVAKLSLAVEYLHYLNIVHRDLKPENIMITNKEKDPDLKLVDFGLSKIMMPGKLCYDSVGTLSYAAPEVLLEQPYGKAVDVWAIGVNAFLFLVGKLPFDHATDQNLIIEKTIDGNIPFYAMEKLNLSDESKEFITSCDLIRYFREKSNKAMDDL